VYEGHGLNGEIPENTSTAPLFRHPTGTVKVAHGRSIRAERAAPSTKPCNVQRGTVKDGGPVLASRPPAYQPVRFGTWLSLAVINRGYKEEGARMPIGQISLPLARLGRAKKFLNHDSALPAIPIRQANVCTYLHAVSGEEGTGMWAR
jgi:hypothetical protein